MNLRHRLALVVFLAIASAAHAERVVFTFRSATPVESVSLAGTFNDWNAGSRMTSADRLAWTAGLDLPPGVYQYKFVVNGRNWVVDQANPLSVDDGNGNRNSVVWVEPAGGSASEISRAGLEHTPDVRGVASIRAGCWTLRLRARRGDLTKPSVRLKSGKSAPMGSSDADQLFEYFTADVPTGSRYVFRLTDSLVLDASGVVSSRSVPVWFRPDAKALAWQLPPDWVRDATIYQILPERFANGDRANDPPGADRWDQRPTMDNFFGGDIKGIAERLSYLRDLGITTIKLNPVFQSRSNHKYDIDDFNSIDRNLGTNEEFRRFVSAAKRYGIRVVLDGVFNHSGTGFFAFKDILEKQQTSAYLDWYHVIRFPVKFERNPNYWTWGGTEYMPKFNHASPAVRKYLFDAVTRWMRMGVIGWRLDAANEVPHDFWREFRKTARKADPSVYIVGEVWGDGLPWLKGDEWDAVMNYPFRGAALDFAKGTITPSALDGRLTWQRTHYPLAAQYAMYNLLGSHDTPRLFNEVGKDLRRVKLAKLLQFTYIGAPVIYYGDEIALEGGSQIGSRKAMEWHWNYVERQEFDYTKRLVHARRKCAALRRGDFRTILVDDVNRQYGFMRTCGSSVAIVILNQSDTPSRVSVNLPDTDLPNGVRLVNVVTGQERVIANGRVLIELGPVSGALLTADRLPIEGIGTRRER